MKSVLKHLREESGLNQAALASIIGTSQGYVSDIERGYRDMTPAFATKAAPELGMDPIVLLCAHSYETIARKDEAGDPDAAGEALALAKRLVDLLEEDLDEEQAAEVRAIVEQLLKIVEGKTVAPEEDKVSGTVLAKKANEGSLRWIEQKVTAMLNPPSRLEAIDAPGVRDYWFVRDVFPDTVVVESEQTAQILSYPYQIDESGELVLDEPREVRLDYVEKPGKRATAKKASPDGRMDLLRRLGGMSRVGGLTEDEAYDRLVEARVGASTLEQLLDEISVRMSGSLISDAERLTLESLQAAIERRIAELADPGARPSEQVLAGDRAAVKARNLSESRERRNQQECYEELGLDAYGRPIPEARREHDRALKSASFLSQSEKELGVDHRGLPLDERRLKGRRYVETGE